MYPLLDHYRLTALLLLSESGLKNPTSQSSGPLEQFRMLGALTVEKRAVQNKLIMVLTMKYSVLCYVVLYSFLTVNSAAPRYLSNDFIDIRGITKSRGI